MQSVSEPISRILTQVGMGVALKPHHTLSSLFRKSKDAINFEQKRGLVYQISCRDCIAVYVGETGRSFRTRKREHADAVKTFNTKKSALSQHVMDFDHRIDWYNVKILKSESHAYRRRVAESFLRKIKRLVHVMSLIVMIVEIFVLFIVCLSPINMSYVSHNTFYLPTSVSVM